MDNRFLDLLACPACGGPLEWAPDNACCRTCGRIYQVVEGIPVLLLDEVAASQDELEPPGAGGSKDRQADFFDHEVEVEFEISRPHGTPEMYQWLLGEKFRRSVWGLAGMVRGATALTVCGGSGLDAEFLARAGARVISSDISLGAARRAKERARRYGLDVTPIVADVEHLPFGDASVDLVYVHDGLHHLENPLVGLAEMARVAGRAVSATEPARALATAVAVRFGLALEREEAGNRVARITLEEVTGELEARGFRIVHADRYAMYYRHQPGAVMRAISRPGIFPVAQGAVSGGQRPLGRWGNKLTVVAEREPAP